jgi:hypothetical protein
MSTSCEVLFELLHEDGSNFSSWSLVVLEAEEGGCYLYTGVFVEMVVYSATSTNDIQRRLVLPTTSKNPTIFRDYR